MSGNVFFLEPKAPFRLDLTAWTLRRRPENIVDRWDGQTYRRVLTLPTGLVEVGHSNCSGENSATPCFRSRPGAQFQIETRCDHRVGAVAWLTH